MPSFFKSELRTRVDDALEKKAVDDAAWRAVCKIVDPRDERACRACWKKTNPDAVGLLRGHRHHIIFRSAGGPDTSWNVCTVCAECHQAIHVKRTLEIEGNADEALAFWKRGEDGQMFLWRREVAVRQFEHD